MPSDHLHIIFHPVCKDNYQPQPAEIMHNKHSRKNKARLSREQYEEIQIQWKLYEFIGIRAYDGIDWGPPPSPSNELSNGLTSQQVLAALTDKKSFQDYLPRKNDCLFITVVYRHPMKNNKRRPFIGNYLEFIFDKQWRAVTGFETIDFLSREKMEGFIEISCIQNKHR